MTIFPRFLFPPRMSPSSMWREVKLVKFWKDQSPWLFGFREVNYLLFYSFKAPKKTRAKIKHRFSKWKYNDLLVGHWAKYEYFKLQTYKYTNIPVRPHIREELHPVYYTYSHILVWAPGSDAFIFTNYIKPNEELFSIVT